MAVAARSNGRLLAWLAFVGAFAALSYASRFLVDVEDSAEPLYERETFIGGALQFGIMLAIVLAIASRASKRDLFALRRPASWRRALAISGGVLVLMIVVTGIVSLFADPAEEQGLVPETWPPPEALVFGLNAIVVVVLAPIVEELTFRGLGFSLLDRFGDSLAIAGTALAFALAHGLVEAFPQIFVFGLGLAYLRSRSGSVYPSILLHGAFNAAALTLASFAAGS